MATAGLGLVRFGHRWGEVYAPPNRLDGLAIWLPPLPWHRGWARRGGALWTALTLSVGPGALWRWLRVIAHLRRAVGRVAPRRRGHLLLLAVQPDRRGQGLEEALLKAALEQADAAGLPCSTISVRAAQALFYVKHGFAVAAEGDLPGNGPHYWILVRPAACNPGADAAG